MFLEIFPKPKSNIEKCRKYNNFPFEPRGIQYNHVIEPSACFSHHSFLMRVENLHEKTLSLTLFLLSICVSGQPLPTVSWKRVRTEITDQLSETDPERGVVRNEMVIDALKREDLLTEVICQASNTNLTAPITESVKLDISLNPTEVQITTPNRPCSAGERVEITCISKGSRPPAKISWWKDGKNLKRYATDEIQDDVTTSKLFLTPSSDDNEKSLICRAENPVNGDNALEDQWVLNVY
ncbi:uncharacterized protein TNIN_98261, partial [Trichonephila inaurata madagascariensis]